MRALVLDGHPANISAAKKMGFEFKMGNTQDWVLINGEKLHVFIDYVHCLKLLRNTFAGQQYLLNDKNEKICWKYLVSLQKIQSEEGLSLANKLTQRHILFTNQKMKVYLAAQVFSKSVADAIQYLRESHQEGFEGSGPTEEFIRLINDLFDILNSRSTRSYGYKRPLSKITYVRSFQKLTEAYEYLRKLRLPNKLLIGASAKKTCIIGFLKNISCLKSIYLDQMSSISFLCGYRFCQDHIELLFNCIRR